MITLKNLSFSYEDSQPILRDLNLTVEEGQVVCLTGPSGCGKTTLIRILNGLIPQYFAGDLQGEASINGTSLIDQDLYDISKNCGSVFQNPRSQFFCLNTTSELAFEPENYGVDPALIAQDIAQVTKQNEMTHLLDRNIFNLSGGERQLLACAAVQVAHHKLIILDEPSSNLDFTTIEKLKKMIHQWKRQGKTIIIAEHRLYYLMDLVDRFIVMSDGQMIEEYDAEAFNRLPQTAVAQLGLRATDLRALQPSSHTDQSNHDGLSIKGLKYRYHRRAPWVLDIDELHIARGQVTALIGHNGAGKSTFARCLTGVLHPNHGRIMFDQQVLSNKERLKRIYMVFQEVSHQLFTESVEEELLLSQPGMNSDEIKTELEKHQLASLQQQHPIALSGGEQQRLAVASAMVADREVLIFDEPSSGLDGARMREMSQQLNELAAAGYTVILITHDYELLLNCVDQIAELEQGSVVAQYALNKGSLVQLQRFFNLI
ncbi:ABC transporter [Staphylococcus auricularis]|uniref:ABC transporter n=2 Tax=Staphylococcus auricularis TaxID=29379 RepID=A0AAP8PP41_9STAP|nr:ABC transporter ATP-binding protein [Staphylococcus auricularis]MDC6327404.1 ABC transporter ATP-binding protein [Staphylococcus auricularis]MDN4534023.1 ABC transporter ATP-binding protein [Staphylococcus auricularis]PNZ67400.1 ABC transporter [Staphylococcus auricularis]QPT05967.1 ABC transporter ATP-binding protein [Staphylococcus auricularis]SQJ06723.1 cobalt ABC transporter ATPase [Staphylococcus auricularis]